LAVCGLGGRCCSSHPTHPTTTTTTITTTTRSGKVLGWSEQRRSWTHDVFFGWNAAVTRPGQIRVGDVLTVLQGR
jgi:uncharacterized protein YcbX